MLIACIRYPAFLPLSARYFNVGQGKKFRTSGYVGIRPTDEFLEIFDSRTPTVNVTGVCVCVCVCVCV